MPDYPPFNPDDPLEQIADQMRQKICDIALEQLDARKKDGLDGIEAHQFMLMGLLTGVCGVAIAHFHMNDDAHIGLRKWLHDCLTQAFDQARGINDMPPLPELS